MYDSKTKIINKTIPFLTLFLILSIIPTLSFSQARFSYTKYINGYWGSWTNSYSGFDSRDNFYLEGDYHNFIIYESYQHPSNYMLKIKIDGMTSYYAKNKPNRKRKSRFEESDKWFEFKGTAEYIVSKSRSLEVSDLNSFINKFPYTEVGATATNGTVITIPVTVRVKPFVGRPEIYNIHFDNHNLGLGIIIK